jgi:hypothetical protein
VAENTWRLYEVFPGRIRFSAQTPAAVQLLQQQAEVALDQIKTHVAVEYNPRTKRGLLTFEKNIDVTTTASGCN